MEWTLLFLIFAVAAAFDEELPDSYNPSCMDEVFRQCELEEYYTVEFPKNKEELQAACKLLLDYADCAANIYDNCEVSDEIKEPVYTAQRVFKRICDENSELFKVVEQNIKCLSDNLEYFGGPCPLSPDETQDLNDFVNAFSPADEDAFQNADMCMEALSRIGCLTSKLNNKCGSQAVGGLLEILQQLDKPFERCGPGVKENLPLITGIINIEEEIAEEIEEMKKKKR